MKKKLLAFLITGALSCSFSLRETWMDFRICRPPIRLIKTQKIMPPKMK